MTITHKVKSDPPHFDAVCEGIRTAELRLNDLSYQVGDTLRQEECVAGECTGRFIEHEITHKLVGGPCLAEGCCMLSLGRVIGGNF